MREYVDPPDEGLIAQPFLKTDLPCIRNYSGSLKLLHLTLLERNIEPHPIEIIIPSKIAHSNF